MKYSFVIAALIAATNAIHEVPIAEALAEIESKSAWVELPDCPYETKRHMKATGQVPLKKDLSNAIIATCKSYQNPSRAEVRRYKQNIKL